MIRLKPEQDGLLQSYDVLADALVYTYNVNSYITACPHKLSSLFLHIELPTLCTLKRISSFLSSPNTPWVLTVLQSICMHPTSIA